MSDIFVKFSYTAAKIEISSKTQQTGHFLILPFVRTLQFPHHPKMAFSRCRRLKSALADFGNMCKNFSFCAF
jgi:hypothetical protein